MLNLNFFQISRILFNDKQGKGSVGLTKFFLIGAAGGAKYESQLDRKENLKAYDDVVNQLQDWNNELILQNQQSEEEQKNHQQLLLKF